MSNISSFQMIDVSEKVPTHRVAVATGRITMSAEVFQKVITKTLPKGDVLALSEVSGVLAAKRTADILPLCHPLPLDSIRIWHEVNAEKLQIQVFCKVRVFAKTGAEMEALSGITGALLCIHDLVKMFDPAVVFNDIALIEKQGGKSGHWHHPEFSHFAQKSNELLTRNESSALGHGYTCNPNNNDWSTLRCGILTISDRAANKIYEDKSGPAIADHLGQLKATGCQMSVVADEKEQIANAVTLMIREHRCDIVFTTGGTGLGARDVTPEALSPLFCKPFPGIGELIRSYGSAKTPLAWLSRAGGGVVDRSLVIMLPGSPKAVREGLESVTPILPHALKMVRNEPH